MKGTRDIKRVNNEEGSWHRKIWTLDVVDMSWVEQTKEQVSFLVDVLDIRGSERIPDLGCGFGRYVVELAKLGCSVVGVEITRDYICEARRRAQIEGVNACFHCMDIRGIQLKGEFDIVLNMADGAVGYLESDAENEKIFARASEALVSGGRYLVDICNADYARKHFPKRHWVMGSKSLSLADFTWDDQKSIMYYGGMDFRVGEELRPPKEMCCNPTRLFSLQPF